MTENTNDLLIKISKDIQEIKTDVALMKRDLFGPDGDSGSGLVKRVKILETTADEFAGTLTFLKIIIPIIIGIGHLSAIIIGIVLR